MTEIDWTSLGRFLPMALVALALILMALLALILNVILMPLSRALGEPDQQEQRSRGAVGTG